MTFKTFPIVSSSHEARSSFGTVVFFFDRPDAGRGVGAGEAAEMVEDGRGIGFGLDAGAGGGLATLDVEGPGEDGADVAALCNLVKRFKRI